MVGTWLALTLCGSTLHWQGSTVDPWRQRLIPGQGTWCLLFSLRNISVHEEVDPNPLSPHWGTDCRFAMPRVIPAAARNNTLSAANRAIPLNWERKQLPGWSDDPNLIGNRAPLMLPVGLVPGNHVWGKSLSFFRPLTGLEPADSLSAREIIFMVYYFDSHSQDQTMKKALGIAALAAASIFPGTGHAATETSTFQVLLTLVASCSIDSAANLDFGSLSEDQVAAGTQTASSDIQVTCSNGTSFDCSPT